MNTVLITGCSSGFGHQTALYFLDQEWTVVGAAGHAQTAGGRHRQRQF